MAELTFRCRECGAIASIDGYEPGGSITEHLKKLGYYRTQRGFICGPCWDAGRIDRKCTKERQW